MKKTKLVAAIAGAMSLFPVVLAGCGDSTDADTVKDIELGSAPTKTEYAYGEALDLAGAKIEIEMTSGATDTVDVTSAMVSGYDANKLGEQTITVTYDGVTLTFTVTVVDPESSVKLVAPVKTEYTYGEELDLAGAKLETETASGVKDNVPVTAAMVSGGGV